MKRTKTQKRNLVKAIRSKSKELFFCDLISTKDLEAIMRITAKAGNKLK